MASNGIFSENATLLLRSIDLPASGSSNESGSSSATFDAFTWNNISLRTLLGTMYDKYDTFNISLYSLSSGQGGLATTTNEDDRNVVMYLSGLPFINNTYSSSTNHNQSGGVIGFSQFVPSRGTTVGSTVTGTTTYQIFSETNSLTFGKSQETCNLTISYKPVSSANFTNLWIFPEVAFLFKIWGIPREDNSKNGKRMY